MEGDYRRCGDCNAYLGFQSTPSAWRETYVSSDAFAASHISNHTLRMVGDRPHPRWTQFRSHFNPLPPHGGRHWIDGFFDKFAKISIHSLRMEGDAYCGAIRRTRKRISIHSLRMEGDDAKHATRCLLICDFNPLPPHGGRQHSDTVSKYSYFISIHSLRMEGDYWISVTLLESFSFQSTPSAWRETGKIQGNL